MFGFELFYENDTLIYQNPFRSNCWETSGTEELNQNGIKLFPNPAYDALTLQLKGIPEIRNVNHCYKYRWKSFIKGIN